MMKKLRSIFTLVMVLITLTVLVLPAFAAGNPVAITKQPESVTVKKGTSFTVSLEAAGDGLTYKWYYKNKGDSGFTYTATFPGNTYTTLMNETRDGRQLYCVVTDQYGNSATTETVTMNMTPVAKITKQPVSIVAPKGKTITVSFTASGEGLTYKWYYKNKGEKKFTYTATFPGNTYTTEMNSTRDGRQLYCVVTDADGNTVQTKTVTISMGNPLVITEQPRSATASKGTKAKVTVSASGDGLKYRWYYKDRKSSKFKKSSNTTKTYSTTMKSSRNGRQVYCVITDKRGNTVKTNTVKLSMGTTLKITSQPKSMMAAGGSAVTAKVSVQGSGLSYRWYFKNKGESTFLYTATFPGNTYSAEMNDVRDGRQVYCVITDKYGSSVKSNTVTFTKGVPLTITRQPASQMVANGKTVEVSVAATGEGLSYKWYYKNKGAKSFTYTSTFSGNTYTTQMNSTRDGRQVYCVVTDKNGKSVKSSTAKLTMGTALKITKQPVSVIAANGATAKVSFTAQGDGLTYKWYYKNKGASKFQRTTSFKGNSYTADMNSSRNGRQLYCVVTDKRGNSVKTQTVTLIMGNAAKIKVQPVSMQGFLNEEIKVSLSATGDGLSYKWYFKDKDAGDFLYTATFKSNYYTAQMNDTRDGRQLYCLVTDKYGNKVQSETVTISLKHLWDTGTVTRQPTCSLVGKTTFHCSDCGIDRTEDIAKTAHTMGEYTLHRKPTVYLEGVERSKCENCSYYQDRSVAKLEPTYYITVDTGEETYKLGVAEDGKYTLEKPSRDGYIFDGWTCGGKEFASSGTVTESCKVKAKWDVVATTTLAQLKKNLAAGIDHIKIGADITVTEPLFVSREVTVYSDSDYTLKRAPGYGGDLFVVGTQEDGTPAVLDHKKAELTLGGGKGTLTIDGNRDNVTVTVKGSAIHVSDSAVLNLYDGVRVANNKKTGNQRLFLQDFTGKETLERAGGAAILNFTATVNMYGGVLENNEVAMKYTVVTEDGTEVSKEVAGCGGAVYNRGNFHMYGGTIKNNDALRGGGVYNDRIAYLIAGTITGNHSVTYGGGISSSSSSNADLYLGSEGEGKTMTVSHNHSERAGGGVYSNTTSPIVIYGNTELIGNVSATSGGGIYTAGTLTVAGAVFKGNSCAYSGGAIYHQYANAGMTRRILSLTDCVLEENSAGLGGGVILSATDTVPVGTVANITGCTFLNNRAVANEYNPGNGAALYITRKAEVTVTGCTFQGNTAAQNAGGIAIHGESVVQLTDSNFTENTAVFGGGIYTTGATANLSNVTFTKNAAVADANGANGNGGGLYIFGTTVNLVNVDMVENTAANNAGGIYQGYCDITVDGDCEFTGNHADGHGGAFYLTYQSNADGTKSGSVLTATGTVFKNNTALAGGAVSIRSACQADLTDVVFEGNGATGTGNDSEGGGAVYVGFGVLNLTNVTAKENHSAGHGGVVVALGSPVNVKGGTYEANEAPSGGAFTGASNSPLVLENVTLKGNKSTSKNTDYDTTIGGGAVNLASSALTVTGCTFDGNSSENYGGTVMVSSSVVKISHDTVIKNSSGATGGALYFRGSMQTTLENISITDNTSSSNGVIYQTGGRLLVANVAATGNKANSGGVLYVSGGSGMSVENCDWHDNEATNGGTMFLANASLTLNDVTLKNNKATLGGAAYLRCSDLVLDNVTFTENEATQTGGAICNVGGTVTNPGTVAFTKNTAGEHAGAVYVSYYRESGKDDVCGSMTLNGGTFTENTAMGGGAVSVRSGCEATFDGTTFTKNAVTGHDGDIDGNGDGGGAIYAGFGKLTLNNVTATENTSEHCGGAVASAHSTVQIKDSILADNQAASGGAIHVTDGGNVTITNTQLLRNKSTYVHSGSYNAAMAGGAIQMNKGTLTVTGCTLDGNTSEYYGGAISGSEVKATITDCTISNSTGSTGAVLCFRADSDVTVKDVTITDCEAKGNGAIYSNVGDMELDNVTVTKTGAYNGILYTSASNVTVKNCTWDAVAAQNGGAIYQNGGTMEVTGMTFSGYSARSTGGAICQTGGTLKLTDCTFTGNTASNGGAIYRDGGKLELTNCVFRENTAKLGGALSNVGGTTVLKDCEFQKNAVSKNTDGTAGNGGAINNVGGTVTGNATFTENTAENHGGGVYASYIANSDSTRTGGVLELENSQFTKNTANGGGAISTRTDSVVTITGSTFTENEAAGDATDLAGGAIYANDNILTVTGCTFDGNASGYYGGTIAANNCNFTLNDNSVVKNSVGATGSALQLRGSGEYKLENVQITDNVGTAGSGVIYITGAGKVSMKNVTGTGNKNIHGGVLYASGTGDITVEGCSFTGNEAVNNGGVLCINGTSKVTVKDTAFEGNTAKLGGAVYMGGKGTMNVTGTSTFKNNTATSGGAVNLDKGATFTMEGGSMDGNQATNGSAGAVFVSETSSAGTAATKLELKSVTVQNNTATARGGAIATDEASPNLVIKATDCTFHKNSTSTAGGGAVAIQNKNCNMVDNPTEAKIVFTNCTFTENSAATSGGAIEVRTQSYIKLDGITARKNRTSGAGAVIYVTSNHSRLFLTGTVTLSENTTPQNGTFAAMYKASSYSNPPKIYTTHASSASWYSQVSGNRDVAFDMATLP